MVEAHLGVVEVRRVCTKDHIRVLSRNALPEQPATSVMDEFKVKDENIDGVVSAFVGNGTTVS